MDISPKSNNNANINSIKWNSQKEAEKTIIKEKQIFYDLVNEYDKLSIEYSNLQEYNYLITNRIKEVLLQSEILLKADNNSDDNNDDKKAVQYVKNYMKFKKEHIIEIFQSVLEKYNEEFDNIYNEESKKYFGINSNIEQLYINPDKVIIQIKFMIDNNEINKTIKILSEFRHTINDVYECCCNYWKLDKEKYMICDDKMGFLDFNLRISKLFITHSGLNQYYLYLVYKNTDKVALEKIQEESIKNPFINKIEVYKNSITISKSNLNTYFNNITILFDMLQ